MQAEFARSLARGKTEERKIAAYLKALGFRVLPTTDFAANGAPMLSAEDPSDSLIMPDLQAFRGGEGSWFEAKWKSNTDRYNRTGKLTTGIGLRHYEHYCKIENEWNTPVVIVFIHEREREVRCGTLHQLEAAFSHDYRGDKMDRAGMRFWNAESIPLWMPLAELGAAVRAHQLNARLIKPPIEPPIDNVLLKRRTHVQQRHGSRDFYTGDTRPEQCPGWTWTCLPCNATWIGDAARHHCKAPLAYSRDFWLRKMQFAAVEHAEEVIQRPIAREQMVAWFGPQWSAEADPR